MDDEMQTKSMPGFAMALVPIFLIGAILLIARSRRKSKDERAIDRVRKVILETELPDRAKDQLLERVEYVRGGLATLRERANEMRG